MITKAIYNGGPYNQIEVTIEGQPAIHKIREIFQDDEKGLRYDVHQYERTPGEFKESDIVPYHYTGIVEQVNKTF